MNTNLRVSAEVKHLIHIFSDFGCNLRRNIFNMPKHRKSSSSSDSDSGPEDFTLSNRRIDSDHTIAVEGDDDIMPRVPPPKKQATSSENKTEDEEGWHLGNKRYLKVREFRGKIIIDIREFYEKDGQMLPGKKGIALTPSQWQTFKSLIDDVDQKISEMG